MTAWFLESLLKNQGKKLRNGKILYFLLTKNKPASLFVIEKLFSWISTEILVMILNMLNVSLACCFFLTWSSSKFQSKIENQRGQLILRTKNILRSAKIITFFGNKFYLSKNKIGFGWTRGQFFPMSKMFVCWWKK